MDIPRIIDDIKRFCYALSEETTAEEIAVTIGTIIEDHGGSSSITVAPTNPAFGEVFVDREIKTNQPYETRLEMADPTALPVRALRDAFGPYGEPPIAYLGALERVDFDVDVPDLPYTCVVLADVEPFPREQEIEDGTIRRLTLLRDIRLED